MSNSSNINSSNINSNNESESNLLKPQGCLSQPLPCLNYTTYCTCSVWMSQYFINITFQIDHIITPHLQTTSASSTYRNTVQHSFSLFPCHQNVADPLETYAPSRQLCSSADIGHDAFLPYSPDPRCGGSCFFTCENLGRMFDYSFPACAFFLSGV